MKKTFFQIFIIFLFFTSIEYNLQWTGFEHEPNLVEVKNEEETIEVQDSWHKEESVYYWNVYYNGERISFLNFWTSY